MTTKKVYSISLSVILLASIYPIYMGITMCFAYIQDGGIDISNEIRAIWERTSTIFLDTKYHNFTKCNVCDSLITDRRKPDYIAGLSVGEYVEEKIYCSECAMFMREKNTQPKSQLT